MSQATPVRPRLTGEPVELPSRRPARIVIEDPFPVVDCGRHRVKRCVGDDLQVSATIFRDGHDLLCAAVRYKPQGRRRWREAPMARTDERLDGDRWSGELALDSLGRWCWQVLGWTDRFATWQDELTRKSRAGQSDLESELAEGAMLIGDLLGRAQGADRETFAAALAALERAEDPERRRAAALAPELLAAARRQGERDGLTCSDVFEVEVERERARFGSWYELFPRSWGGLEGVRQVLPELADLGFDVVYLPPIHPIGVTRRKGRNDATQAQPGDPGSPWAIGSPDGGHTDVHPELGTIADVERLTARARELGMDIALDYALQCSADHPWLSEHPEWFFHRPDGTLKYAENPPKRYMDIYNFDFDCADWRSLWQALRDVMLFWVERGVRVFRVDNPHTKPIAFWEWLIESVRRVEPEVVLLSEAFTREAVMSALAKVGFSQSYTYFAWKNSAWELRDYIARLARPPLSDYLRANLFLNTPDILSEYLQRGGPAAFAARLLLGATMSPSYGIYSGFENFEATPRHEGSEEYLDSEKYELRERRLDGPLLGQVRHLNHIRREHRALRRMDNIAFLATENDALIAYAKRYRDETLLIVVNVDPHNVQEGIVVVPHELGLAPAFAVEDLLDGDAYGWRLGRNYVRLDPAERAGHLLLVDDR